MGTRVCVSTRGTAAGAVVVAVVDQRHEWCAGVRHGTDAVGIDAVASRRGRRRGTTCDGAVVDTVERSDATRSDGLC